MALLCACIRLRLVQQRCPSFPCVGHCLRSPTPPPPEDLASKHRTSQWRLMLKHGSPSVEPPAWHTHYLFCRESRTCLLSRFCCGLSTDRPGCLRPTQLTPRLAFVTTRTLLLLSSPPFCACAQCPVSPSQPVSYAAVSWLAAPSCWGVPNPRTSVMDDLGRMWGWQDGASCAYKSFPPIRGSSPAPEVTWEAAPPCLFTPTRENSVPDTKGRLWGWQNAASCAFKG